ncbi:Rho GTPase-activating protein 42 [Homalodisca vitripennis]|nr:Rho GTPase-activating protein 42 [Homalodisca vitripennis]
MVNSPFSSVCSALTSSVHSGCLLFKCCLPLGSGGKMSLHYATSYRPQDNVPPGTPNSLSSGRSSPGFSQGVRRVRTLYACMGENDGELSFEPNQIITNVRTSLEPGWLEGTLNGKTGLVPENYVELLP